MAQAKQPNQDTNELISMGGSANSFVGMLNNIGAFSGSGGTGTNSTVSTGTSSASAILNLMNLFTNWSQMNDVQKGTSIASTGIATANASGAYTGKAGTYLAMANDLYQGYRGVTNNNATASQKSVSASKNIGMAVADFYTAGLASLGRGLFLRTGFGRNVERIADKFLAKDPTLRLAVKAGAFHSSTKAETIKRFSSLSDMSDDPEWQKMLNASYALSTSNIDPDITFSAKKKEGTLTPDDVRYSYGVLKTYGPEWAKKSREEQDAILGDLIKNDAFHSKKGDIDLNEDVVQAIQRPEAGGTEATTKEAVGSGLVQDAPTDKKNWRITDSVQNVGDTSSVGGGALTQPDTTNQSGVTSQSGQSKDPGRLTKQGEIGGSALAAGLLNTASNAMGSMPTSSLLATSLRKPSNVPGDIKAAMEYITKGGLADSSGKITLFDGTQADINTTGDINDASDVEYASHIASNSLVNMITGGNKNQANSQLTSKLAKIGVSGVADTTALTPDSFNRMLSNQKAMYAKSGITSRPLAYGALNQLYANGNLSETEYLNTKHGVDMIFNPDGMNVASNLMGGRGNILDIPDTNTSTGQAKDPGRLPSKSPTANAITGQESYGNAPTQDETAVNAPGNYSVRSKQSDTNPFKGFTEAANNAKKARPLAESSARNRLNFDKAAARSKNMQSLGAIN